MANHPFSEDVHRSSLGEEIELFMVDPRAIDASASVMYFCSSLKSTGAVKWKNAAGTGWVDYTPIPIEAEGFQATAQGTLPRPRLRISNIPSLGSLVGPLFSTLQQYQDLLGAKVTRYRTLGKYLYGGAAADYHAHWPADTYVICQKTAQNPLYIEWELAPYFDAHGIKLPKRLILRDVCQLRYRIWDADRVTHGGDHYVCRQTHISGSDNAPGNPTYWQSSSGATKAWEEGVEYKGEFVYDDTENACPLQTRLLTPDGNEFDFAETGSWDLSGGWTISGGKLNHASGYGGGANDTAWIRPLLKPGVSLCCSFDATVTSGSSCTFGLYRDGIGWVDGDITISSTGSYSTLVVTTWTDQHALTFWPNNDFVGSIDNLSLEIYCDEAGTCYDDPAKDVCAHNFGACQARWHGQPMPFTGFPSIARVRI